jgi:PTH1 family peptidyl-tRNA hydrolase
MTNPEENQIYLVVGLGNPGAAYQQTRHNIGFKTVRRFAEKAGFAFHKESHFSAELAQGRMDGKKAILLLPMTYMNSSGQSAKMCADYFKVSSENVLVVCDDIALPFGHLRFREEGSAGGHNGLKSIEEHLGTRNYPRIKIGIGDRTHGDLSDYVLGKFTADESAALADILEKAAHVVQTWILKGKDGALRYLSALGNKKEEKSE